MVFLLGCLISTLFQLIEEKNNSLEPNLPTWSNVVCHIVDFNHKDSRLNINSLIRESEKDIIVDFN